ncbi:MAG: transcriptional regulator [Mesorhizobium sp.]
MTLLERSPQSADTSVRPVAPVCRCLECGDPFPRGLRPAEFCGRKCVQSWNNRRMTRGAEIYDLIMTIRYDRQRATLFKVWRTINRLAALFREQDRAERANRRSWRRIEAIRDGKPFLWNE